MYFVLQLLDIKFNAMFYNKMFIKDDIFYGDE